MLIDFDAIPENVLEHFKGGLGEMIVRAYKDDHVRLLRARLTPGSTIGLHTHEGTSEIIFILSGTGRMLCGDAEEALPAGACHYCPPGCAHSLANDGPEDLCFLAVVPDHRSCR